MSDLINRALEQTEDTRIAVVRPGAIEEVVDVFEQLFAGQTAIVVGDERTMAVAGNQVLAALRERGIPQLDAYVFPGDPELYASYENVEVVRDFLAPLEATAIAVGAGTLNDLVKRACGELGRAYMQVGTAASMDGYTAFGASITNKGFKITHDCPPPTGSVSDLTIMAAAPQVMTASGYGDLIGKLPAGADWILADALGIEPIDPVVWDLVQGPLRNSLAEPAKLAAGDVAATGDLTEGLIMSGLAMQVAKSSRPASGAEHQFSHLWEMEGLGLDVKPRRLSHGFKVGLGTISICALYQRLFERDIENFDTDAAVAKWPTRDDMEAEVRRLFPGGSRIVEDAVRQQLAKWVTPEELRERIELLKRLWPELQPRLANNVLDPADAAERLATVGAPSHPSHIGVDWDRFRASYERAGMIRARYTVLDTVRELGILDELVDELFAADGFWGRQQP